MIFPFLSLFLFCYNPDDTNRRIIFGLPLTLKKIRNPSGCAGIKMAESSRLSTRIDLKPFKLHLEAKFICKNDLPNLEEVPLSKVLGNREFLSLKKTG